MSRRCPVRKRLDPLRKKERRIIMGIETGRSPGELAAAVVEISGNGDDTMLALLGFTTRPMSRELVVALGALERREQFGSEELAGINFLVLHNLTQLYDEALETADAAGEEIDVIGLKCLEAGAYAFPTDPGILSEMTNRVVASRFRIGTDEESGDYLAVRESLLQGIVSGMIDRFSLGDEVREAVTVALLANEAIFSERAYAFDPNNTNSKKGAKGGGSVRRIGVSGSEGAACLCGEFFFPR
jgi:hypothetical protein